MYAIEPPRSRSYETMRLSYAGIMANFYVFTNNSLQKQQITVGQFLAAAKSLQTIANLDLIARLKNAPRWLFV